MTPASIAALYLCAGLLWVYLSGSWFGAYCNDTTSLTQLQLINAAFILITAGSLYGLLRRNATLQRKARAELESQMQERTAKLMAANEQLWQEAAQRKHTEEALRESEARYRLVVENQSDLICHYKPDGTITFVNSAYCHYFGKTAQELIGQKFLPLIPPEDLELVNQAIASLTPDNPRITVEHRVITPNGELGWQQWSDCIITNEQGKIVELQGVGRDISERKRAEDKLRRLQAELAHAARLSIAGEMAKSVAHELNQPLTAIVTYTQASLQLLKTGQGQTRELLDAIEQAAVQGLRAGEIIRRMRAFTQIRTSRQETVDIGILVSEVASLITWEARQQQVNIRFELAEHLPPIATDVTQIQQVLVNLLNNAIEILSKQPDERQITLRTAQNGSDAIEISVSDSGSTLPPLTLEKMFDSFLDARPDSIGVRLALSRSLVEAQGGKLWATPNPLKGNTFCFTLPLNQSA